MKPVLAQRLRAARAAIHPEITQRAIAKECEVSPSAVSLWEAGKPEPSATHLVALAKRYRVTTDWLLGSDTVFKTAKEPAITYDAHHVPLLEAASLAMWQLTGATQSVQTSSEYPENTAAAMVVTSEALTSVCPA